jgi:hypothetical protein
MMLALVPCCAGATADWVILTSEVLAGVNAIVQVSDRMKLARVSSTCIRVLYLSISTRMHERLGFCAHRFYLLRLIKHTFLFACF